MEEKLTGQSGAENFSSAIDGINVTTPEVRQPRSKNVGWRLLSLLLSICWLVPIVALLVLNFEGYIAGASVGCGVEHCVGDLEANATTLDTKDHNALGGLQIAAKALEIWFIIVVSSLMYDLTMCLANRGDGIPFSYLLTPVAYADLLSALSWSRWRAATPFVSQSSILTSTKERTSRRTLYGFVFFIIVMSLTVNLMGPATAVLLIPTLGWRELPLPQTRVFSQLASSAPPENAELAAGCDGTVLTVSAPQCTSPEGILDPMLMSASFGYARWEQFKHQGYLSYSFNASSVKIPGDLMLIPLRQALQELELRITYSPPVSALEVQIRQQAPALSFLTHCSSGLFVVEVSEEKTVRCYTFSNPGPIFQSGLEGGALPYPISDGQSTMCIRIGSGWNDKTSHSAFSLGSQDSEDGTSAEVNIYASDRAIYLEEAEFQCTADERNRCDWDRMFAVEPPTESRNTSINPQITEYSLPGQSFITWCRSFAYQRFPLYVWDTSLSVNPLQYVLLYDDVETNPSQDAVSVHPDWTLAAWAVENGGVVSTARDGPREVLNTLQTLIGDPNDVVYWFLSFFQYVITARSLYLINYSVKDIKPETISTPSNPIFQTYSLVRVWSYSLESRTSKLGAAVAIFGCACVILRIIVGLSSRTVKRSLLQLLTTALEQDPPRVFEGKNETEISKVRLRMKNVDNAKFEFS